MAPDIILLVIVCMCEKKMIYGDGKTDYHNQTIITTIYTFTKLL